MTTRPPLPTGVSGASGVRAVSSGAAGDRLVGIDVARALALLGMVAAHVGTAPDLVDPTDPSTWTAVVHGRSSTLFAVLAGVSVALVSGRTTPPGPPRIGVLRARLAIRAAVVVAIGLLLMALGTNVYVILPTYGALFLLAVPVLRLRARWLLLLAAGCAVCSVPAALVGAGLFADVDPYTPGGMVAVQLGLVYPVVTFFAYLLVGMALGRSDLPARTVQRTLATAGTIAAVVSYGIGALLAPVPDWIWEVAFPGVPSVAGSVDADHTAAQLWLSPRDHSSTLVDVVGTAGVAVAVIGVCLLLCDRPRVAAVLTPLAAVGAMPLSVYTAHLVVIAVLAPPSGTLTWWCFAVGAVVAAVLWRRWLGRGPLERLVARIAGTVRLPDTTPGR